MTEYTFSSEFQEQIAALILRDNSIISSIRTVVEPEYFSDPTLRSIITAAIGFHSVYRTAPTKTEFLEFTKDHFDIADRKKVRRLFKIRLKNPKYILDEIVSFAQYQSMKTAIITSTDMVENYDNRVQIRGIISEALKVGADVRELGTNLIIGRSERYADRARYGIDQNRITTGIPGLDKAMRGGLDIGELGIVMAPPKGFKTGTLLNFGAAAIAQRKTVLHYTLEVAESKMILRYESRFSGLTRNEIIDKPEDLEKALRRIEKMKGGLVVKGFPMRSITVDGLHNHTEMLKAEGLDPDLIIVDYVDVVKPSISGELRHQLSAITADLRSLGQEHNVPLWSASLANKKSVDKKIITMEHVSEDFNKIAICDTAVAICQTKEERQVQPAMVRLFMAANREGEMGSVVAYCEVHYNIMRLKPVRRVPND